MTAQHYLNPPANVGELLVAVAPDEEVPAGWTIIKHENGKCLIWRFADGRQTHFPWPVVRYSYVDERMEQEHTE